MNNLQTTFRLVVVDEIVRTHFIWRACVSVSEKAIVYPFHPLSPAKCIGRNKFKITFLSQV
jgi:hypothetical protein